MFVFLQLLVLLELFSPVSSGLRPWVHVFALSNLVAESIPLVVLARAYVASSALVFSPAVLDRAVL